MLVSFQLLSPVILRLETSLPPMWYSGRATASSAVGRGSTPGRVIYISYFKGCSIGGDSLLVAKGYGVIALRLARWRQD